jgi:hypothetical protein
MHKFSMPEEIIARGPELRRLFERGGWDYPISKGDVQRIGSR